MRYFISNDINKNDLLKIIIGFTILFFVFLWITNLLLYLQIGFSYESVVQYYLGSEESFRPAKSYIGLLQESHFHFFSMAILLVTLNHLILFASIKNIYKGKTPKANELINVKDLNKFDSIGGWSDENNNYYLDLNIHLDSKDDAIKIGNLYDQLAVYDLKENKVINLNK